MLKPLLLLSLLLPNLAAACTETSSSAAERVEAPDEWLLARIKIPWTEPSGEGFGFGYASGSWGGEWTQELRLRIPIYRFIAMGLRGIAVGSLQTERWDLGGRIELIGQPPVFLNLVRLYGGGGLQVFRPVSEVDDPKTSIGGGGHFGFEFFMGAGMSWILEIGGSSGVGDSRAAGATIIGGVNFYPSAWW